MAKMKEREPNKQNEQQTTTMAQIETRGTFLYGNQSTSKLLRYTQRI